MPAGSATLDRRALQEGTYLTDGKRLVQVVKVERLRVVCEEGSVELPYMVSLSFQEAAANWRVVEPSDG